MRHWRERATLRGILAIAVLAGGCASESGKVNLNPANLLAKTDTKAQSAATSDYDGKRARLAVLRFTDSTGTGSDWGYNPELGEGMARKLTAALVETRRFQVVSRRLEDVMNEIDFGASGVVTPGQASAFGRILGTPLVLTATITDFHDPGTSGPETNSTTALGMTFAAAARSFKKTYMAVNLEVVDTQTGEIVASEQVHAKISSSGIADSTVGTITGDASFQGVDSKSKGQVMQEIINQAAAFLAEPGPIPDQYFTVAAANQPAKRRAPDQLATQMQGILKRLGYYQGTIDGQIGPTSQKAIMAFQRDYKLDVTGALDPQTSKKLLNLDQ